jgi:hypothetical protein
MPFECATRRHFRVISAYAETASPPGGISISYETLIRQALPHIPCIFFTLWLNAVWVKEII